MIHLKRAYDEPSKQDGLRFLVERLWPHGVRKDKAAIDLWLEDLAPSTVALKNGIPITMLRTNNPTPNRQPMNKAAYPILKLKAWRVCS